MPFCALRAAIAARADSLSRRWHPSRRAVPLLFALAAPAAVGIPAMAQRLSTGRSPAVAPLRASQPQSHGRIQGTLFDSLTMKPVAGANVMLMTSGRRALSDDRGRFTFDSVSTGQHEIGFTAPALDSAGLGVMGRTVTIAANQSVKANLATPSFRTFWSNRCNPGNTFGPDSTIMWGTVRDAATDSLRSGVSALFTWFDLRPKKKTDLLVDERRHVVQSDANGNYFACGLPRGIAVSVIAASPTAASGEIEVVVGARRVQYMDFTISGDMVLPDSFATGTREDSVAAERLDGRASVRGVVVDAQGIPLANAIVALASMDSAVRTKDDGSFLLEGLPAGTHALLVRRVGSAAASKIVQLRRDVTTEATISLAEAQTLAAVNVRAVKTMSPDRKGYEYRKRFGQGFIVDSAQLNKRYDLYGALYNIPNISLVRSEFGIGVTMKRLSFSGSTDCVPTAFLNGMLTRFEEAAGYPFDQYRAIEVYNRPLTVPAEFYRFGGCGTILFWTRNARW